MYSSVRHVIFILEMPDAFPFFLLHEVRFILIKVEEEEEGVGEEEEEEGEKEKKKKKEAEPMEPLITIMKINKQHFYNIYSYKALVLSVSFTET